MARRRRGEEERSMDSLMDALTNVVGILLLILIVSSLGITAAVRKVVESLPEVTEEEVEAMKASREKTLKNLQELKQTRANTLANLPTDEEAAALAAELEEFEENNEELADKTSDIEEWKAKVEEQLELKDENEEKVSVADERNRELAAILAQTPEREVKQAKEVAMPNPRISDPESRAFYLVCKFGKLYFIGDPYDHAFRIRDVIEQNFSDLAFSGKSIGSYTYAVRDTRKDDNDNYIPLREDYRLSRREKEALGGWNDLQLKWANRQGELASRDISVVQRMFGSDDKAEFTVAKFRYDAKKITEFFGEGKFGPKDFKYYISGSGGDRMKMELAPKEDGGWTPDEFLAANSQFEQYCKQASTARRILFYFYVAPDSFETYLQARARSEQFRVPAGWTIWEGERLAPRATPQRESIRYDLSKLPEEDYMKLARSVGPYLASELNAELTEVEQRVAAAVPDDLTDETEKKEFISKLTAERHAWNASRFQPYVMSVFQTPLAAEEASGETEIALEIHPPEIPGIRTFNPSRPPTKPRPPRPDNPPPKPKPEPKPGGTRLILD